MGYAEQKPTPIELQRVGSQTSKSRYVFRGLPVSPKPQWRIVFPMFVDWLFTVAVSLSIFGVLYFYSEDLPIMGRGAKRVYNGIITGLSIFLGLVVSAGFNETMLTMRWWIMNRRYLSVQKIEKILQVENLKEMVMLACKTTRLRLLATITAWIALAVASQVAVAALGLAYGLEVVGEQALLDKHGFVAAPDMGRLPVLRQYGDHSSTETASTTTKSTLEYTANSYGLVSLAYGVSQQTAIPKRGQLRDATDPLLFCTGSSCTYVFYERGAPSHEELAASADAASKAWRLIAATDRSITVTSMCNPWRVVAATWSEDTPSNNLRIQNPLAGSPFNITFPVLGATNQTAFVVTNTTLFGSSGGNNAHDITKSCDTDGCVFISVLEYTPKASWFYTCWTNTSSVANAMVPEHEVAPTVRNLAARAIGLGLDLSSGGSPDFANSSSPFLSMQIYPSRSPVVTSNGNGNASEIAASLSRYAIGVLAVAAEMAPSQIIPGSVPQQGVTLKVDHWENVVLILGSVIGCHFMLTLLAAWVAVRKVIVPPCGPLAHAQIFRPIAGFLSLHSKQSTSVEGEDEYSDRARLSRWRYQCVWIEDEGKYDLFLEEDPLTAEMSQGGEAMGDEDTEALLVSKGGIVSLRRA